MGFNQNAFQSRPQSQGRPSQPRGNSGRPQGQNPYTSSSKSAPSTASLPASPPSQMTPRATLTPQPGPAPKEAPPQIGGVMAKSPSVQPTAEAVAPQGTSVPDNWPTSPGRNDFGRKLTEPEYQARWDDLLSREPVQAGGQRSDLPTWGEFMAQSAEFNGGVQLDPRAADSAYRNGPVGASPMTKWNSIPRLPGKEMAKWKGGKYTGDGTWEHEGTGGTPSGGGPGGGDGRKAYPDATLRRR